MTIKSEERQTHHLLMDQFINNPDSWPGRYPCYALMADGGTLCHTCVSSEAECLVDVDPECPGDDQWRIVAVAVNWEDTGLPCDNCGSLIESAYGEDGA